jgi:hypothetical protein
MPAAVAARPRDGRGYPALAITPWVDGEPRFAATGTARAYLCAVERRCSVCGTVMPAGPVWRVVAAAEAAAIAAALAEGRPYVNRAATVEAPGHRTCMLYAAVVCPYLARPTARRATDASLPGLTVTRGDRRGFDGAVVGFDEYEFRHVEDAVLFRFTGLREFLRHQDGSEHLAELRAAIAAEAGGEGRAGAHAEAAPAYLLADERAAQDRFTTVLAAPS